MMRDAFSCGNGIGDGFGHTTFALQFRGERVVMRRRDHAGDQIGDGSADHSGLAEGGEHLIDVMQEG